MIDNTNTPAVNNAPRKRVSRIAPIQAEVLKMLRRKPHSVADMAKAIGCAERDVRSAIDRSRAGKGLKADNERNIERIAPGVFGYRAKA